MHPPAPFTRAAAGLLLAVTALATAAGCSSSDAAAPAASQSGAAAALSVTDPWVKATDSGMTGVFGTLVNSSDRDVRIVSAATQSSRMELHEMAMGDDGQMVMRPKKDGFLVPARGTHVLAPGGDHMMVMDLATPIKPGDDLQVTLTADDGSTVTFAAAARSFSGANENYAPAGGTPSMQATP